jgi:type I restriction enzyme S subunit
VDKQYHALKEAEVKKDWRKVRLGDVIITNCSSYSEDNKWEFVNYLDTGNITENRIDSIQMIDLRREKLPSRARRIVKKNNIVYSTVRPIQRHYGILKQIPDNFLVSTGFAAISSTEKADPFFIYYYLTQNEIVESLQAYAEQTVSTYPAIKASDIENLQINLPPLPAQRAIAATLSCLDEKIELNRRINANLEAQAQAIFKSWFVDFEPWGGVMPAGWAIGTINDIATDIVCGKTPSTKVGGCFGNDVPFITIPDMHGAVYIISTERSLSAAGAESQSSKTIPENSVCVSCIATAGLAVLTSVPSQTNQQINTIVCKNNISPYYVYLTMVGMSEHIKMLGSSGSATNNLNKGQFSKIEILIPENSNMAKFSSIVEPLFDAIKYNQQESACLAAIRDILLPKLMSGEIRPPEGL